MKKNILTSILTVLTLTGMQAQTPPPASRLVIGLTVDQLRTDYIEAFSSLYGEKGFKRLWKEGKVFLNATYNFNGTDRASAMAAVYTGSSPSVNGIVGRQWLDVSTLRPVGCVDDPSFMGYYTPENSSANQLLTSTVGDELKISTSGKGIVYSIAPFRDAAILAAGHAADGAFWLNDMTGKWCGTTYYGEFPLWVSQYNDKKSVDLRIPSMVWTPALSEVLYINLPEGQAKNSFKHKFEDSKRNKFKRLIVSPFINDEINALVEDCLAASNLGMDNVPDFLSITYYAGDYLESQSRELEIQDMYVRLDRSLGNLLDIIDRKTGLQNVVFFIISTGYNDNTQTDNSAYRLPGGEFHMNRCAALLNMYLMATYGDGKYVDAYYDTQIYLNHKLIEEKQLNPVEIQTKAADFLIQFSGVNDVYSSYRILLGAWTPDMDLRRNKYHRKRSGDLVIDVLPGWSIVNENGAGNKTVRHTHIPLPVIFMGSSLKPEIIHTPVTTDRIAPTLSYFMRIRAPNACTALPLMHLW